MIDREVDSKDAHCYRNEVRMCVCEEKTTGLFAIGI